MAVGATFQIDDDTHPRGCIVTDDNKVRLNVAEILNASISLQGKMICWRERYINGTANTNPDTGCTGQAVPITTWDQCHDASICDEGDGADLLVEFQNRIKSTTYTDRPKGCFREHGTGAWGFNAIATAPATVSGVPVCRNQEPQVGS